MRNYFWIGVAMVFSLSGNESSAAVDAGVHGIPVRWETASSLLIAQDNVVQRYDLAIKESKTLLELDKADGSIAPGDSCFSYHQWHVWQRGWVAAPGGGKEATTHVVDVSPKGGATQVLKSNTDVLADRQCNTRPRPDTNNKSSFTIGENGIKFIGYIGRDLENKIAEINAGVHDKGFIPELIYLDGKSKLLPEVPFAGFGSDHAGWLQQRATWDNVLNAQFWHIVPTQFEEPMDAMHPLAGWWVSSDYKVGPPVTLPKGPWIRHYGFLKQLGTGSAGITNHADIFVSNGNIFTHIYGKDTYKDTTGLYQLDAKGEWKKIVEGVLDAAPVFSPDGSMLAYAQEGKVKTLAVEATPHGPR